MKNKRVLYIFLILFFIVTVVLLSSVLFSVNNALLSPMGETSAIDSDKVQQQLNSCIGGNIFFVDEKGIISQIEKENPYIRAINIERIFPSTVKLHYSQRKELFEIQCDSGYLIIDYEGKVIAKSETSAGLTLIDVEYFDAELCDVIDEQDITDILNIYKAFTMLSEDRRMYDEALFNAYFQKVYKESSNIVNLKTHYGGEICITDYNNNAAAKLYQAFQIFEGFNDHQRATEKIYISN